MNIELDIFYYNEDTLTMRKLDENSALKDNDIRQITFYNIDSIAPHFDENDEDKEYSCIKCGSEEYFSPLTYKQLKDKIYKHLNPKINITYNGSSDNLCKCVWSDYFMTTIKDNCDLHKGIKNDII